MTQTVLLGDVKVKDMPFQIIDGDRGAKYPSGHEFSESGYCLFLSAKNVTSDGFDFNQKQFITKEKDTQLRKGKLQRHDVVLTTRGTVGNVAFYSALIPYENIRINSGMVILRCDNSQLLPEYLYFILKSSFFQDQVLNFRSGSAQPQLPIRDMQNMRLPLHNIKEQREVANQIGTIDEKIELNRQMNEKLEQMGRALFKHYFIDNPEAGKWQTSSIGKECDVVLGGTPSRVKDEYWANGTVGWINSGKVNEFRIVESSELITEIAVTKSAAKIMPTGTTVLAITGATLGQVSRLEKPFAANQSVIGILGNDKISNEFMYFWINENIEKIIGHQTGGAQQHINRGNIINYDLLIPPTEIILDFQNKIMPIMNSIAEKCFEIQTLTILRDTLLPRLISGKVKV